MGAHDGAVDHGVFVIRIGRQKLDDLLPRNSHVVELGPFGENGHEAEAI